MEDSARTVAELHMDDAADRDGGQRVVEAVTRRIVTPKPLYIVAGLAVLWIAVNAGLASLGRRPFDPYPFSLLQGLLTLSALIMTLLIFALERRLDEFEQRRAKLMLQLNMLIEQKTAKIIDLLEEMRRDSPALPDRHDRAAEAMKQATDPRAALEAIEQTTDELKRDRGL